MKTQLMQRTSTTPIPVKRSIRRQQIRALTSLPAGKMVPLAAIPLLREDGVRRSKLRCSFEMHETVEMLMNAVHVDVKAYLVPTLAFDRFDGMDSLNRSYNGEDTFEGSGVKVPYIETNYDMYDNDGNVLPFYKYMGLHGREGENVNSMYLEAYNAIWNFRARNRSADITLRDKNWSSLAPAFWKHQTFAHIVPDFDQAVIDGEVALNVSGANLKVHGIAARSGSTNNHTNTWKDSGRITNTEARYSYNDNGGERHGVGVKLDADGYPEVYAEMAENGITVSLSNIELAKKTAAFAKLRERYTGHTDDYIIDLLMQGITVPEQAYRQPMLIGQNSTVFGMSKRYATDGADLTKSVVNGGTFVDLSINVPRIPVGGVIMVVAEITPEQLFERQKDYFLHAQNVDDLPNYMRDELDPEKVSIVTNDHVDMDHDTPSDTFGYAPLNHQWDTAAPRIGGRFYRPKVDAAFDEARQRIWAVETKNPKLAEDFYLCTTMHTKPFHDTVIDPFECVTVGEAFIEGNTVFGGMLIEAQDNYKKVLEEAPTTRIDKGA